MASLFAVRNASRLCRAVLERGIHSSQSCYAITQLAMPAMSPTMTEGGIANWKKKEGESFSGGDILLEIETDKATIDVEAQDDGIIGKIILGDGSKNVPVGKTIALLAEEGDEITNLEVPEEKTSPAKPTQEEPSLSKPASDLSPPLSTPEPTQSNLEHPHKLPFHNRPLFPSVQRLVLENHLSTDDLKKINGTGVRGMLTKGDILAHIGKASSPWGTSRSSRGKQGPPSDPVFTSSSEKVFDADTVRHIIFAGLRKAGSPITSKPTSK